LSSDHKDRCPKETDPGALDVDGLQKRVKKRKVERRKPSSAMLRVVRKRVNDEKRLTMSL